MTLTKYSGQYEELFRNAVWYSDGSLNSDGTLANLINSTLSGTITGATKTGTDRFGIANKTLLYNGSSNYVGINNTSKPSDITIIGWFNLSSTSSGTIFSNLVSDGAYINGCSLIVSTTGFSFSVHYTTTNAVYYNALSIAMAQSTWLCVAATRTGSTLYNYKNGNLISTSLNTGVSTLTTGTYNYWNIGRSNPSTLSTDTFYFPGLIGEIIIYNRVLSSSEIKTIYDLTSKKYLYPTLSGIRGVQ